MSYNSITKIVHYQHNVNQSYDTYIKVLTDICYVTKERLKKLIGQRVVELRTKKGWSQADLARETGKDRQAIEKLENGKVNPTLYSLLEIAKAMNVSLSVLVDI
jgi:putative transcriptional regulator